MRPSADDSVSARALLARQALFREQAKADAKRLRALLAQICHHPSALHHLMPDQDPAYRFALTETVGVLDGLYWLPLPYDSGPATQELHLSYMGTVVSHGEPPNDDRAIELDGQNFILRSVCLHPGTGPWYGIRHPRGHVDYVRESHLIDEERAAASTLTQ